LISFSKNVAKLKLRVRFFEFDIFGYVLEGIQSKMQAQYVLVWKYAVLLYVLVVLCQSKKNDEIMGFDKNMSSKAHEDEMLNEGIQYQMKYHDVKRAKSIYEIVLQRNPSSHTALQLLGALAYEENDFHLAIRYVEQSIELSPSSGLYYCNLGQLHRRLANYELALKLVTKCYALVESDETTLMMAYALLDNDKKDPAIEMLDKVLKNNKMNNDAREVKGLNSITKCLQINIFITWVH